MKLIGTRTTAGARGRERQHGVLPAVVRQQRDAITGRKPVVVQRGRGSVDQTLELGEGQYDVAVDDRGLVRLPAG